jgi:hypothetical protein
LELKIKSYEKIKKKQKIEKRKTQNKKRSERRPGQPFLAQPRMQPTAHPDSIPNRYAISFFPS